MRNLVGINTVGTEVNNASASVTTAGVSVSTAEPITTVNVNITTAELITPPTTTTVFEDEDLTIAQTLVKMRSEKSKGNMVKQEKPLKKKDQIKFDEEIAQRLQAQMQAELEEEERLAREREEDENIVEWDNTQAMMDKAFDKTMSWIDSFVPMDSEVVEGSKEVLRESLDEGYSSKNYVRKFLRALHPKWRAKVMAIEESKDLTSLSLDELIGNFKVHEMIIKKDSKIVKAKVKRKCIALKAKKESSNEECSTNSGMKMKITQAVIDLRIFLKEEVRIRIQPRNGKQAFQISRDDQTGEEDDEKVKDKTCLVAHASSEVCSKSSYFSDENSSIDDIALEDNEYDNNQKPSGDKLGLEFNSFEASSSGTKEIKFVKAQKKASSDGVDLEPDEWIKDSGCSKHMTGNQKLFSTYKAYNGGNIIFGSNLRGNIIGKGQICDNKCKVTFSEHDSEITKNGKVIGVGQHALSNLFYGASTRLLQAYDQGILKLSHQFRLEVFGTVRFGNDHVLPILGFDDLQWGNILDTRILEVAFKWTPCSVRHLEGVDLLKGNQQTFTPSIFMKWPLHL
ncbi:retrovirus-related pol polyprotein from transposon TNT 1-94 [Tanacetum coccineum]